MDEADPPAQEGRVPDFFLVGHGKSGTTALYQMLSKHPQIFVGLKEPRFFATEMNTRDIPRPGGTPKTLAEYKAWFKDAKPDQLVGDISPWYLWSQAAPSLIATAQPNARIIAILREPASFLRSLHLQWLQLYVESETDFRRAMELEEPRRQGREVPLNTYWPKALLYSDHVRYTDQLRRYHKLFARDRVLVLIYDDYRRDNVGTLRKLLRFLEVDDELEIPALQSNPSVQVQATRINSLLRSLTVADDPASRAIKTTVRALTPQRLRQGALRATRKRVVLGEPSPPDEELMADLRRRFKGEVVELSEYLGRDLVSLWGYDSID
ncbi:MAG: sulfotransferase family protein [Solirubrobacteraceae bacterium]